METVRVIVDDFSGGKAKAADVPFAGMHRDLVEYFAARGNKDAKAWLKAHPPKAEPRKAS